MNVFLSAKGILRRTLESNRWALRWAPASVQDKFRAPGIGRVRFGDLRGLEPIDRDWGFSRGTAIDRYYIERFLADHAADIRGRVLEIGESTYTRRFGGTQVTQADVLHYVEGNPAATIVGDLATGENIESDLFDCIIITQTLQMIYDVQGAIRTLYRILKPGGVVLMTGHGTSKVARIKDQDDWGEYWRFTRQSGRQLFGEVFGAENVEPAAFGNVLVCTSFLQGIAAEELTQAELDHRDTRFEVLVVVRARKPNEGTGTHVDNG